MIQGRNPAWRTVKCRVGFSLVDEEEGEGSFRTPQPREEAGEICVGRSRGGARRRQAGGETYWVIIEKIGDG